MAHETNLAHQIILSGHVAVPLKENCVWPVAALAFSTLHPSPFLVLQLAAAAIPLARQPLPSLTQLTPSDRHTFQGRAH